MGTNPLIAVFHLIVLIFSVIVHEISHGYAALKLGDPTARDMKRLTLNPVSHIDLVGSILLPLSLFILSGGAFVFGWAKPVPFDPRHFKDPVKDSGKVAVAGPISNFALTAIFGIIARSFAAGGYVASPMYLMLQIIVATNVFLGVFNLVPLPPLDGSKVLFAALPRSRAGYAVSNFLERYGMMLLLVFLFFGIGLIEPIGIALIRLFMGGR